MKKHHFYLVKSFPARNRAAQPAFFMNELDKILNSLNSLATTLHQRANAALTPLPPLEQIEGAEVVRCALREFRWASDQIVELKELLAKMPGAEALAADESLRATIRAELIEKEGFIVKEDHESLLKKAEEKGRDEAQAAFDEKEAARELAATRRTEAAELIGEKAADALSDEDLASEAYEARIAAMKKRVDALADAGVDETMTSFASLLALPLDEAGNKDFDTRVGHFAEINKKHAENGDGKPPKKEKKKAGAPELPPGGGSSDKKKELLFV